MPRCVFPWVVALGAIAFLLTGRVPPSSAADTPNAGKSVFQSTLRSTVWIVVPHEIARQGNMVEVGFISGSGSLIDVPNRLILTNYHVVTEKRSAVVMFPAFANGKLIQEKEFYEKRFDSNYAIPAEVVVRDSKHDLALLRVARVPEGTTALKLSKDPVGPGETVHALGNPGASGALWAYTPGSVKARYHKQWLAGTREDHIAVEAMVVETTSPLNPGDSGGPVVNDKGELVAVTEGGSSTARNTISLLIDVSEVRSLLTRHPKLVRLAASTSLSGSDKTDVADAKPAADDDSRKKPPAPDPAKEEKKKQEKAASTQLMFAKDFLSDGKKDKARERLLKLISDFPDTAAAKEAKDVLAGMKK